MIYVLQYRSMGWQPWTTHAAFTTREMADHYRTEWLEEAGSWRILPVVADPMSWVSA